MKATSTRKRVEHKMPGTIVDLRKRTGLARSTVAKCIKQMVAEKACHIHAWVRGAAGPNAPYMAIYTTGEGQDAPCPVPPTGGKRAFEDSAKRVRKEALAGADKMAKTRDPWLWWLFDAAVTF